MDGFLIKTVPLTSLMTDNIKPTLDEITMFEGSVDLAAAAEVDADVRCLEHACMDGCYGAYMQASSPPARVCHPQTTDREAAALDQVCGGRSCHCHQRRHCGVGRRGLESQGGSDPHQARGRAHECKSPFVSAADEPCPSRPGELAMGRTFQRFRWRPPHCASTSNPPITSRSTVAGTR